jgi:hypothetical protein
LYAACEYAMLRARLVSVRSLGYSRHDADVLLLLGGLVASGLMAGCARVRGVMVSGSAALVGMCARCALGQRECQCEVSWLCHTRDV